MTNRRSCQRYASTSPQYHVIIAADGTGGLQAAGSEHPDLGLPDIDGVQVIRTLRAWTRVPIVVLSGRADSRDKVDALDAGADDYVTKPFSIDELLARMRAVTRRTISAEIADHLHIGGWTVNLEERDVHDRRDPTITVHLTKTEWHLLDALARNPGKLLSQRQLLQDVWGPTYREETQYLRQHMAQLRRKLEDEPARPKHLLTEPGMGYRFHP